MLDTLKPIGLQLEAGGRQFRNAISDIPEAGWLERMAGVTNHAAFLALHVLDARCYILKLTGVEVLHGFEEAGKNADRLEDIAHFPRSDSILEAWERVAARTAPALDEVTAEALEAPAPRQFPVDDPTLLGALSFLAQHEAYHVGQLGLIRRAIGLPPLSYK